MQFLDPHRPTIGGHPAAVYNKRPCFALPRLTLEPDPGAFNPPNAGLWRLSMWLLIEPNLASQRHAHFEAELVPTLLAQWLLDPEHCLAMWFNYHGPKSIAMAIAGDDTGLAALGL